MLYLTSYLTDGAMALAIFAVSRGLAEAGASLMVLGLAGAGIAFAHAAASIICGYVSDSLGRIRVVLTGAILFLCALLMCLVADPAAPAYLIAYVAIGAGAGTLYPPLIAWLNQGHRAGASRGISRTLILFCVTWNAGLITGQLGGGVLFGVSPRLPLAAAVAMAALSVVGLARHAMWSVRSVAVAAGSPEVAEPLDPQLERSPVTPATFILLCWVSNLGGAFAISMVFHLLPDLAVLLGVPPSFHGSILAFMRVTVIATYLLMHSSRFWRFRFRYALLAQGCALGGLLLLAGAAGPAGLMAGVFGIAILGGYNYFASLYYSTVGRDDSRRGFAAGLHEATLGLGMSMGALGGGVIGTALGPRAPYQLAIGAVAVAAAIQLILFLVGVQVGRKAPSAATGES